MTTLLADDASPSMATLVIRPWPDPVIDALGHDPRSAYVERFWLGVLGPSTTWLLRLLAAELEASPDGCELDLREVASMLGLGTRGGRHSPFMRALGRCCRFDLAEMRPDGSLAVRRRVPPLNRRQLMHLPPTLQDAHQRWQEANLRVPAAEHHRRRGRRLALSLLELGEERDEAEHQLLRWGLAPDLAQEAVAWAWEQSQPPEGPPPAAA